MSVKQVKAFFAKIKEDSTLAQKLKDAQAAYKGDTSDKAAAFAEIVIPVAKSAGFNFTVDDFKATFDNNGEGEASGDELDAVAGGMPTPHPKGKKCGDIRFLINFCDIITQI